jgi:hypothetical protein
MSTDKTPPKKTPPQPSESAKAVAKYFEIQIVEVAMQAFKKKEYLKAALLSWSFLEEYFLPTFIKFIGRRQGISIGNSLLENANASALIKYYYLISYDKELYDILMEAKKRRNKLVHEAYKSGSLNEIAKKAKDSAQYNLSTAIVETFKRLGGEKHPPSLQLYSKGWNDMREAMKKQIDERIVELNEELEQVDKKYSA